MALRVGETMFTKHLALCLPLSRGISYALPFQAIAPDSSWLKQKVKFIERPLKAHRKAGKPGLEMGRNQGHLRKGLSFLHSGADTKI